MVSYAEMVASYIKSVGVWRSPMDIANEITNSVAIPIPAQFLSV